MTPDVNQQNNPIEPVKFTPSDGEVRRRKFTLGHYLGGVAILLVLFVFWFLFTSKSVQINFSPKADSMAVDGGFSFELGGVYLLREGTYTIRATADLHEPLEAEFSVGSARNQSQRFVFTPLPGFLELKVNPGDAVIHLVDSHPADPSLSEAETAASVAPQSGPIQLPAGQHNLTVSHPRYLPRSIQVDIEGKQITQTAEVTLDPNWAEVAVASTPPGADIFIDDTPAGQTPAIVEALAGEREIQVKLDGYKTHTQRIFAQAGVEQPLDKIALVQADAQLHISSTPTAAGVTVNGQFMGRTPISLDLKSGQNHQIAVIRNGYTTYSQRSTMARGEVKKLHANLSRQLGEVVFVTQPADAQLKVNGRLLGSANQTVSLPIEAHSIEISLDGYAGYKQSITPKAGLTQEVKVRLLTVAQARLKALTPTITSPGGQVLRLFQPFDFTMGASRREPGRRANETLREVSMDRLFYLGTHEVTNAQFRQFASGHDSLKFVENSLNDDDMPVVNISWHDAAAYCNWLSEAAKLPRFYNIEFGKVVGTNPGAKGYRLPTEAEWAWAARTQGDTPAAKGQGETSMPQLRFPWGQHLPPPDRFANFADRAASTLVGRVIFGYNDNYSVAAPVGTYKANTRGLYDMGGNVAEWTNDYYEIPSADPVKNPTGPSEGEYRVIRDSSWMHGTITELRYSFRDYGIDPRTDVGFRLARNAE